MMKKFKTSFGAGLFFLLMISVIFGQSEFDSAIHYRNDILNEYQLLEEKPGPRTWDKMSDINLKAQEVIAADNTLINDYLTKQLRINSELQQNLEKLTFELSILKRETELQADRLDENKYFFKILLAITGGLGLVLIVLLVLFVDRQIKYRSIKIELERTWPAREEMDKDNSLQQEITKLNKQIGELMLKNTALNSEANSLKLENVEHQNRLEKEISSRKQIEEEIKNLINQIKVK